MLESLHVKNLALIDEAEVTFTDGLNILTGETGAGKSIIIGSINLALGAKADKDYIRNGAEYALVELIFSLNAKQCRVLEEMELPTEEDGTLLLQRKIAPARSTCKVNGETVSSGQLRALAGVLLDMYGQHEHQSLLKPAKHKAMLDDYAGDGVSALKKELKKIYTDYQMAKAELDDNRMDEDARKREADLLQFEVNELESAAIVQGEDEQLEKLYRRMSNAKKIKEAVYFTHSLTGYDNAGCAGEAVGRALRELRSVGSYEEDAQELCDQLAEIDNLLNDFNRSLANYSESLEFDEEEFIQVQERLNLINRLKDKYGNSYEKLQEALTMKTERLEQLAHYEEYLQNLEQKINQEKTQILELCRQISEKRMSAATVLTKKLTEALVDLNFLDVDFEISVEPDAEHFAEDGYDKIGFLISTNPGEKKQPLQMVASGGELSRIMLAFKSVFADEEGTDTLIFDEIDTGISGRTAWKVSEKLGQLSKEHQIICITHLPQIAAMADTHFLIEKNVVNDRTATQIVPLEDKQMLDELARLLGGDSVTEAVLSNAAEMRQLAGKAKQ
ncbi:MAG: DNA repair protein RecN [Lachnospiraceae bacterium]|nr:DNA repair protein RecN [Lachnospiraceae bacterium]